MHIPSSLPIAQVHTPQGSVWYVAQARSKEGFVAQRRYHGVNEPDFRADNASPQQGLWAYHEYAEAYLEPFLNLGAVQAAGLSAETIYQWVKDHPGEVFTHPTYASLCLRWGENTHGYRVEEFEEQPLTPDAVPFTPHTCWASGTTYYQWAGSPKAEDFLWEQMRVSARLRNHGREIKREGKWSGWYTTDRRALEQALANLGRHVVLVQPRICYGVFTEEYGNVEILKNSDTAEEALAYFMALPEVPGTFHCPAIDGTYVCFGSWVQWPGQAPEWNMACAKHVLMPEQREMFLQCCTAGALPLTRMRSNDLLEQDFPCGVPLVTLAAVLATTGQIRWRLAAAFGWSLKELSERERDPSGLTLADVERIGELTQRPVERLLMDLHKETRARAAMSKRDNVQAGVPALR